MASAGVNRVDKYRNINHPVEMERGAPVINMVSSSGRHAVIDRLREQHAERPTRLIIQHQVNSDRGTGDALRFRSGPPAPALMPAHSPVWTL